MPNFLTLKTIDNLRFKCLEKIRYLIVKEDNYSHFIAINDYQIENLNEIELTTDERKNAILK